MADDTQQGLGTDICAAVGAHLCICIVQTSLPPPHLPSRPQVLTSQHCLSDPTLWLRGGQTAIVVASAGLSPRNTRDLSQHCFPIFMSSSQEQQRTLLHGRLQLAHLDAVQAWEWTEYTTWGPLREVGLDLRSVRESSVLSPAGRSIGASSKALQD